MLKKKNGKLLSRPLVVYFCVIAILGLLPVRILLVGDEYSLAAENSGSKSLTAAHSRGIIYDRRLRRLTCENMITVSAVKPTLSALNALRTVLDDDEFTAISREISQHNPVVLRIGNSVNNDDIMTLPVYNRYSFKQTASHVIGYLSDGGTRGVSGIESSFDSVLNSYSGRLDVRYFADANGSGLPGTDFELVNNNYNNCGGVVLTIDKNFQSALESAADKYRLKKGAAVILDINSGEIVAALSRPDYDRNNISASLTDENLPLFNRILGSYPVGSVFKPLVAACALEQGADPLSEFECKGYTVSGGKTFSCMKNHGSVNMASALAFSCNCYFIDLIEKLDTADVLETAKNLGFGSSIEFAQGMCTYSGNIPEVTELDSAAARANFSFGQGTLTANAVQVACLYAAIANGGEYKKPYLVKGFCDENMNIYDQYTSPSPVKVFSKSTADIIGSFLELAVREGTGSAAQVENCRVGGKTATAQTGEYIGGKERVVTWFAGFYPYEKPEYVLVVMCEDGESGSADCAPVFSTTVNLLLNNNY